MRTRLPRFNRWRFSLGVVAPAVLLLVVTAAAVLSLVVAATQALDERALQHETALVAAALAPALAASQPLDTALAERTGLAGAGFSASPVADKDLASYPVLDAAGRVQTFLHWQPNRPGTELLHHLNLPLALALATAALLVAFLLHRLWRTAAALEAEQYAARRQAEHDALTGLANRGQFERHLARALGAPPRHRQNVSLLMLDLDHFKQVNDTLGHRAGDTLICAVGQRLGGLIGPADVLARLGGDEFAIMHTAIAGKTGALSLAQAVLEAVSKPFDVSGSEAFVGASIGLASAGRDDGDHRELARKADIALYEAKNRGRGRVVAYEANMNEQLQDRHRIEGELREALRRTDQLSVAYQPLYSEQGEIAGAEALLRWTHPELGLVSPARFVPVAESTGLIEALGEFVLRDACRLGARWPGLRIAVNISPVQLRNPRFPTRVFDILAESGMRPADLELEITEGILLESGGAAAHSLGTLRKAGIRIALDDFGTGYSSLNYLKRYPVDCIKIDRSFVSQLLPRNPSVAIVQAMVSLAHALKIDVTAEGVETHEQLTMLKAMRCNTFQGFLLSPPISMDAVEGKFRRGADRRREREATAAA